MGVSHIKLNKRAASNVIKLGIVGFELQSKTAMDLFFMQHRSMYSLVSAEHADVLIIDMEHPAVKPVVEQYRNSRPIIAVTATENEFPGFETLRKPLDGKRLIKAINQAIESFVPADGDQQPDNQVRNEGEKAFQAYQKRLATGRQAMADYKTITSDRDQNSSEVRQRFQLDNQPAPVNPESEDDVVKVEADTVAPPKAQVESAVAVPVGRKAAEKKPQDVKARLSYQMVYECCGNAPDVNMYEPDQRRRVFFKEDSTLLAILQQAIVEGEAQKVPVEITGLPGTLAYIPEHKKFLFDFSEDLLIPLALTRFGYQELTLKVRPDLDLERPSVTGSKVLLVESDEMIWKLALWTSKGRLNRNIDPEQPHRLTKGLDFERLLAIPHATTISSLWGRHSLSALEVVKVLKIHQRYVFSFMTAAYALGAFRSK
ncbi:hypothetical protein SAMN03080615_01213 [Amphritea atlantica]|uniref:Uncharacterized protein n=1 Tax=Amphritea atlantica TaxID=355243 RepID=A0A1H9FFL3_9GAMM|nr:hypothetical protein [Amphritea atlantica]SEQ36253.1 hypothetical protein SAMN03080615_01213 [Amphritea atlantica]